MDKNLYVRKIYLEKLREIATVAVVFLHIVMTINNNYTISEIGQVNYTIFSDCYMLVKWAVPCFIMITGSLLLNPQKDVSVKKIVRYVSRMLLILFSFGTIYALIEIFFNERTITFTTILRSIVNTASGNTWSHMWYIYVLIALYILTIPIKSFINTQSLKTLKIFIIVLIIGNFAIPTINAIFNLSLEGYMMLNEYASYYMLGYYLSSIPTSELKKYFKWCVLGLILSTGVMVVSESISLLTVKEELLMNHHAGELMVLIQSASVFLIVKYMYENNKRELSRTNQIISLCSFGIYLIHPFWINLIYKFLKITPLSFPIVGIGIVILFIIVFILSLMSAYIMKKIPIINKIV